MTQDREEWQVFADGAGASTQAMRGDSNVGWCRVPVLGEVRFEVCVVNDSMVVRMLTRESCSTVPRILVLSVGTEKGDQFRISVAAHSYLYGVLKGMVYIEDVTPPPGTEPDDATFLVRFTTVGLRFVRWTELSESEGMVKCAEEACARILAETDEAFQAKCGRVVCPEHMTAHEANCLDCGVTAEQCQVCSVEVQPGQDGYSSYCGTFCPSCWGGHKKECGVCRES